MEKNEQRSKFVFFNSSDDDNGNCIKITYKGYSECKDDFSCEEKLLDHFLEKTDLWDKMYQLMRSIRTITRYLIEQEIIVTLRKNDITESVRYKDGKLSYYYKNYRIEEKTFFTILYENNNLSTSFNGLISDFSDLKTQDDIITQNLNMLSKLKNVEAIKLSRNDIILIKLYRRLYGENPDFLLKDTASKIAVMVGILQIYYSLNFNDNYCFALYNHTLIPKAYELLYHLRELEAYGLFEEDDEEIKLSKEVISSIAALKAVIAELTDEPASVLGVLENCLMVLYQCVIYNRSSLKITELTSLKLCEVNKIIDTFKAKDYIYELNMAE